MKPPVLTGPEWITGDPPPRDSGRGPGNGTPTNRIAPTVDALRDAPGRWAIIARRATANQSWFSGYLRELKDCGCEAVTRNVDGVLVLYARWPQ